jgi:hypothetical protein
MFFFVSMHILLCYIPLSYMCPIEKNGYIPLSSQILQSLLTRVDNLYNSQTTEISLSYWQKNDATLTKRCHTMGTQMSSKVQPCGKRIGMNFHPKEVHALENLNANKTHNHLTKPQVTTCIWNDMAGC